MRITMVGTAGLLACLGWSSAGSVELGKDFELHGYGTQNYFRASDNEYLGADDQGSWDNNLLALVGTLTLNEKSKLWFQLESVTSEPVRFDWFFVDYRLSDQLRIQVGRVKMPFGIYNETIDARYLQLSALTPGLYQGAADFTHDAYQGVGLDYEKSLGAAGSLRSQIWGGNAVAEEAEIDLQDRRAFGGKFTWSTPLMGLKLMASGFRTKIEIRADGSLHTEDRGALSLDYVNRGLDLKAEYANHELLDVKGKTYYLQAGYNLTEQWTPYVRYDYLTTNNELSDDPSFYQKTYVIGLGYRINNNFNVRLEDNINRGYALPVANEEVAAGEGKRRWNMLAASINFIF